MTVIELAALSEVGLSERIRTLRVSALVSIIAQIEAAGLAIAKDSASTGALPEEATVFANQKLEKLGWTRVHKAASHELDRIVQTWEQ